MSRKVKAVKQKCPNCKGVGTTFQWCGNGTGSLFGAFSKQTCRNCNGTGFIKRGV